MAANIPNGKDNVQLVKNGIPLLKKLFKKKKKEIGNRQLHLSKRVSKPLRIQEIDTSQESRLDTFDGEFNRVLGGGIVPGSLILLGGEPGIGKAHCYFKLH